MFVCVFEVDLHAGMTILISIIQVDVFAFHFFLSNLLLNTLISSTRSLHTLCSYGMMK